MTGFTKGDGVALIGGTVASFLVSFFIGRLIKHQSKYDRDGYDSSGYDKDGFDRSGYNADGYNRNGFDADGYRRDGYNAEGYNRLGFDCEGYGYDGYNQSGIDRAGHSKHFYAEIICSLRARIGAAYRQMKGGEYRYAVFDSRVVLEETLRLMIQHTLGDEALGDKMLVNLKTCERERLLGTDADFIDQLHDVRHICNSNGHKIEAEANMTHNKVYFVIMKVRDLLDIAEKTLIKEVA